MRVESAGARRRSQPAEEASSAVSARYGPQRLQRPLRTMRRACQERACHDIRPRQVPKGNLHDRIRGSCRLSVFPLVNTAHALKKCNTVMKCKTGVREAAPSPQ